MMKVEIRDVASVAALRPLEVASYFRASGWKQTEVHQGSYAIWTHDDQYEALLPLNTNVRDFALRMGDILSVLAQAEDRSQLAVLSDLLVTNADVLRVRLADNDLADGSMPIEDHVRTAQKVRDLMMAAACSTIDPRPIWHKRKPDKAVEYLRNVRIGQTERGSYVLTVISKVPPLLRTESLDLLGDSEEPYERQVTTALAGALVAVEGAAESAASTGAFDGFEQAVRHGVSANLCEAIAGLALDADTGRAVDFAFSWSRTRPASKDQVSRVVIAHDHVQYIQEAARVLRERAPIEGFELEGPVIKLERADGESLGYVTIFALVDDSLRRVRIELEKSDYDQAIRAHQGELSVRCSGRLVREGRGYILKNPAEFSVQAEET